MLTCRILLSQLVALGIAIVPLAAMADEKPNKEGAREEKQAAGQDLQALTKALTEAMEKGDAVAAREAMAKLQGVMLARPMVMMKLDDRGGADRGAKADAEVQRLEEKMASLEKSLEGVKDSPEAREALEKTIAEFKKKIAEARQNGELRGDPAPANDNPRIFRVQGPFDGAPLRFSVLGLPAEGRLGINIAPVPEALADQLDLSKGQGVLITRVSDNSAAAKAGFKMHDIILAINSKAVLGSTEELIKTVNAMKADEKFEVTVLRKGKKETLKEVLIPANKEIKRGDWTQQSFSVSNDQFKIVAEKKNLSLRISGRIEDGKAIAESISGQRDGAEFKTNDVTKLEVADREAVEQLLKNIGGRKDR